MCNILPGLVQHLFAFICSPLNIFFTKSLDFIKLCTIVHDFSRVTFATELSTNLVYNSIFVIDYDYIYFFPFVIFLCNKQKSDDQFNTH